MKPKFQKSSENGQMKSKAQTKVTSKHTSKKNARVQKREQLSSTRAKLKMPPKQVENIRGTNKSRLRHKDA